jgi:pilus assembly protein FimV
MVAKRSSRALALLLVAPSAAFALGLGDIRLLSPLNSPLDAEIDLVDATPEELVNLKAQIASRDTFAQHGLDWPNYMATIQVRQTRTADGRDVLKLKSTDVVTEPFVTLLVQLDWSRGHLLREYTMLLDPPVYTPPSPSVANAPVATPSVGTGNREGEISRAAPPPSPPEVTQAPAPEVSPPAAVPSAAGTPSTASTGSSPGATSQETASSSTAASSATAASSPAAPSNPGATEAPSGPSAAPSTVSASESTHLVRHGETLSQIAAKASGDGAKSAQTRAWILAIYEANPRAFQRNMNLMRSGAVLRMPDAAAVAGVSPAQASAEIRRQYAAWRESAPARTATTEQGHLRLVTPTESASASTPSAEASKTPAKGTGQQPAEQAGDSKRPLEVHNAELGQLQSKLASEQGHGAAAPAATPAKQPPAPAAAATPPAPTPAPAPQASAPEAPTAVAPPAPQPAPAPVAPPSPKKAAPAPASAPPSGGSLLDSILDYWWALALVVVAVAGFFGLRFWRARRESGFDDSLNRLAAAGAAAATRGFATGDTPAMRTTPPPVPEDAFLVEESGAHEQPRFAREPAPAAPAARHVSADDTISSETAINLDQGDPLAEADFHMAYGLYDQAADLIRIAIGREPARRDLKLKLLEVFFVWGNKDQFLQTARELAESRAEAAPGEWEKIVIMGKQLAPEDPLFVAGGATSGAAAAGVDLNLEGGQSRVDFDLLGEPVPGEAAGVDLDIGSALGDAGGESPGSATDRNAAIDPNFSGATTGTTRQMTQRLARDIQQQIADAEAPTVEQPALADNSPTLRQKVEMAMRQGNSGDQTAELAIDDLGLDVGGIDTIDQPGLGASPDAPTLVAGLDERSRRVMEEAQRRAAGEDKPSATGTWHMDENELDAALGQRGGHGDNGAHDNSETSRLAAIVARDVDYDVGESHEPARGTNGANLDLDVGTATIPDAAFASTQKLSSDDLALPELEPVTMSEVGTKLDLARAYMDMGDPDGARNILEEVLHEGSATQKQEAQRLMESLPG